MPADSSSLADRFAIRELIDRYCYAVNERDWTVLESCYTEDAVWDVGKPLNFRLEGRKAIVAIASTKISEEDYVVQTPHATMIWLDGEWRFKMRTYRVTNIEFKAPAGDCYREWPAR